MTTKQSTMYKEGLRAATHPTKMEPVEKMNNDGENAAALSAETAAENRLSGRACWVGIGDF